MRRFALGLVWVVGCGWDAPRHGERPEAALGGAGGVVATDRAGAAQEGAGEAGESGAGGAAGDPAGGSGGGRAGLADAGGGGAVAGQAEPPIAASGATGNPDCLIGLQDGATTTCSVFFNGTFTCLKGVCTGCPIGKLDCNGLKSDGCETHTSNSDCSGCGFACPSGKTCVSFAQNSSYCQ